MVPKVGLETDGAKGGTRTHTLSLAADFESAASTNSATLASAGYFIEKNCSCLVFYSLFCNFL